MAAVNSKKDITSYFTNVHTLRNLFDNEVKSAELANRIWMIHGMAGVGKRSLLLMYREHCKVQDIPCGMAAPAPEIRSSVDILSCWSRDLAALHYSLPTFNKALRQHVQGYSTTSERSRKLVQIGGKFIAKTAESIAGPLAEQFAGIPSVMPVGPAVGTAMEEIMAFVTAPLAAGDKELLRAPEGGLPGCSWQMLPGLPGSGELC